MTLMIRDPADPIAQQAPDALAHSDSYDVLLHEIRKYCADDCKGRSFLLGGHRGAGKSTIALAAIQRLTNELEKPRSGGESDAHGAGQSGRRLMRPLLIQLHGPSLFGTEDVELGIGADDAAARADARATRKETQIVLEQITLSAYRKLAEFAANRYREVARTSTQREAAAQLRIELDRIAPPQFLRKYWDLIGALDTGVFFPSGPRGTRSAPPGAGYKEIVALATAGQAYRRIEPQRKSSSGTDGLPEVPPANAMPTWMTALVSVITGGGVFGSLSAASGALPLALATGAVSALVAAISMRFYIRHNQYAAISRDTQLLDSDDPATLDRTIPILIQRIRGAGLAPVFVVDELDKVPRLDAHIGRVLGHIKRLVAEDAFFCFVVGREYYELLRQKLQDPYPPEYTYFSMQSFVSYTPDALHHFVNAHAISNGDSKSKKAESAAAQPETVRWPYVLLCRAMLHQIDLRRELVRQSAANGQALRVLSHTEVMMQIAVEFVLHAYPPYSVQGTDGSVRQRMHDAAYFPVRSWRSGKPGFSLNDQPTDPFGEYMAQRLRESAAPNDGIAIASNELHQYRELARKVADLLSLEKDAFTSRIQSDAKRSPDKSPSDTEDSTGGRSFMAVLEARAKSLLPGHADHRAVVQGLWTLFSPPLKSSDAGDYEWQVDPITHARRDQSKEPVTPAERRRGAEAARVIDTVGALLTSQGTTLTEASTQFGLFDATLTESDIRPDIDAVRAEVADRPVVTRVIEYMTKIRTASGVIYRGLLLGRALAPGGAEGSAGDGLRTLRKAEVINPLGNFASRKKAVYALFNKMRTAINLNCTTPRWSTANPDAWAKGVTKAQHSIMKADTLRDGLIKQAWQDLAAHRQAYANGNHNLAERSFAGLYCWLHRIGPFPLLPEKLVVQNGSTAVVRLDGATEPVSVPIKSIVINGDSDQWSRLAHHWTSHDKTPVFLPLSPLVICRPKGDPPGVGAPLRDELLGKVVAPDTTVILVPPIPDAPV